MTFYLYGFYFIKNRTYKKCCLGHIVQNQEVFLNNEGGDIFVEFKLIDRDEVDVSIS